MLSAVALLPSPRSIARAACTLGRHWGAISSPVDLDLHLNCLSNCSLSTPKPLPKNESPILKSNVKFHVYRAPDDHPPGANPSSISSQSRCFFSLSNKPQAAATALKRPCKTHHRLSPNRISKSDLLHTLASAATHGEVGFAYPDATS